MVLHTAGLDLPIIEPVDTPVTYPPVQSELANKVDAAVIGAVTVSTEPPPADPPPARDGLLWVQVS